MTTTITAIDAQTGEVTVRGLTPEETALELAAGQRITESLWTNLRDERNRRLAETDYFGMPDVVMSDEMKAYRQALRDLPANTADPANPVWPVNPLDPPIITD